MSIAPGCTVSRGLEGFACHPQWPAVPPAIWSPGLRIPQEEAWPSDLERVAPMGQSLGPPCIFLSGPQIQFPLLYVRCRVSANPVDNLTQGQFLPRPLSYL